MTILIVNDYSFINGGASQVAVTAAIELRKRGHRLIFVTAVGPADPRLVELGVEMVCTNQPDLVMDTSQIRAAVRSTWNAHSRKVISGVFDRLASEPCVVHVHLWYKSLSASVVREALNRHIPVVVTLHDYSTVCPNGTFYNFRKAQLCHLVPSSAACLTTNCDSRRAFHKVWRVIRFGVHNRFGGLPGEIRHFVTVTRFSRDILARYLPPAARMHLIPNPIGVEKGEPAKVREAAAFACIGRLSPEKGPDLFAQAAAQAGVPAKFVGSGELEGRVKELLPTARLTGWLDSKSTLQELSHSRALVLASRCYETQGLVVAEAAALGVPAVVPDTSAARDMVVNGETGFWFKGGDVDSLAKTLEYLKDPEVARRMGLAAYNHYWRQPMTLQRHADELEAMYAQLLAEKSV